MFTKVVVSSLLLAALANGLVFKRDDGHDSSTVPVISLPTVSPTPVVLPDPSFTLSLPPLDPTPTSTVLTISLPDPTISLSLPSLDSSPTSTVPSISLPDPSISLSLPPLDPTPTTSPTGTPLAGGPDPSFSISLPPLDPTTTPTATLLSVSSLPSVVTTTVYVYPTDCSPSGTIQPTPGPSGKVGSLRPEDSVVRSSPLRLPDVQETPLVLPRVRRDGSVLSQLRAIQQKVVSTWVDLGKGNEMVGVVGQLESLIAQAGAPGADGPSLLKQAQSLVGN